MQCVNHPDAAATGICTRCDQPLCAQCAEDRNGRTFCQKCGQFLDQRAASRPHPGAPPGPPPPPAGDPYQAPPPPPGGVYQGPAPGGDVYQGPAPVGDVYQGPAPGGDVYQGPAPDGDMYQGPAPDGEMYQGDVYQGDMYQPAAVGAQAPKSESMSIFQFLFSFNGSISVGEYWLKYLIPYYGIIFLLTYLETGGLNTDTLEEGGSSWAVGFIVLFLYPSLAISVKRLHDRGRTGWFLLIGLIPIIGSIWLTIELAILGGAGSYTRR